MGIKTEVSYFTLPEERVGALVRCVKITNTSDKAAEIEVLDGMPAVIPYGVMLGYCTDIMQTAKAWMQVEEVDSKVPFYRVRASMDDTAAVTAILGGNFAFAAKADGSLLAPIVDPMLVFDYDCSMRKAIGFENHSLEELYATEQITMNQLPSAFFGTKESLKAGESVCIYELIGQVEKKEILDAYVANKHDAEYFAEKK